jgi:hypothetical protein
MMPPLDIGFVDLCLGYGEVLRQVSMTWFSGGIVSDELTACQ